MFANRWHLNLGLLAAIFVINYYIILTLFGLALLADKP